MGKDGEGDLEKSSRAAEETKATTNAFLHLVSKRSSSTRNPLRVYEKQRAKPQRRCYVLVRSVSFVMKLEWTHRGPVRAVGIP